MFSSLKKKILPILILLLISITAFSACSKVDFKVSFIVDGDVVATVSTNGSETVKMPADPQKEGYIFDGWYWDKDVWDKPFTANSLLDTPLSESLSVYAKWKSILIEPIVLNAPSDLKITGNNLSWQLVENAEGYIIQIDGEAPFDNGAGTSFSLSALTAKKVYSLKVKAKGNGTEYLDSEYSAIIEYTGDDGHSVKSADGFTMTGNLGYCKVSNTTEVFSFIEKITVSPGAEWTVSTDIKGTNIIPTKTIDLAEGDNTVHILVKAQDSSDISLYTFTIRRRPIYTVSFNMNGGTPVTPQYIEEDSTATQPDILPQELLRNGYTFAGWDFDFETPITANTAIPAVWSGNKYTITFDACGGTTDETTQEVTYGSAYELKTAIHEYYTFGGWYTAVEGGGTLYENSGVWSAANNIELYAYWLETSYLQYTLSGGTYTVSKATSEINGAVFIPDYYQGLPVTSIANNAFSDCAGLTGVVIGNRVTSIGNSAFSGCSSLTSITLPFVGATLNGSNNTHFGYIFGASLYNTNSLYVPASLKTVVITGGNSIGSSAFSGCRGLTSINIPDSVTSIGSSAFSGCRGLTSINIPDSVTSIGSSAFYRCTGLTGVVIGNSVTRIGDTAFYECTGLTSVVIGNSVTSIGNSVFNGCMGLTSVTIGNGVTSIGSSAFFNCSGLTSVVIGNSITSIGDSAFYYCSGLTSIIIPDSVTSIGNWVFAHCSGLTSIIIPDGVTSIGEAAFSGCRGLMSIVIPDNVTSIGNSAFQSCNGLTSVTIGNGVTSIGSSAFSGCSGLTSVTIGNGVTSIGGVAFGYCSELTSITIPDSVTSIGYSAFQSCSSLTSVAIGNGVTSIGDTAFSNCSSLTNITVNTGNTKYHSSGNCIIETSAKTLIAGCSSSVIPSDGSVTSIKNSAFSGCSNLTSIQIPSNVTSIGDSAFNGCKGLTSITIPDGVTSIGNSVFNGCSGLTSITIPDGVTSIGRTAFQSCSSLTSITIPDSVTSIGGSAFNGCTKLTSLTVNAIVPPTLDSGALRSTSSSLKIYVPSASVSAYKAANGWSGYASKIIAIS